MRIVRSEAVITRAYFTEKIARGPHCPSRQRATGSCGVRWSGYLLRQRATGGGSNLHVVARASSTGARGVHGGQWRGVNTIFRTRTGSRRASGHPRRLCAARGDIRVRCGLRIPRARPAARATPRLAGRGGGPGSHRRHALARTACHSRSAAVPQGGRMELPRLRPLRDRGGASPRVRYRAVLTEKGRGGRAGRVGSKP